MAIEKYEETLTAATWAGRAGWQGACLLDFWIDSIWRYEKETTRLEREGKGEKKMQPYAAAAATTKGLP